MANQEHLKILKKGVVAWNEWREKNPTTVPDLSDVNLERLSFSGYNLNEAQLFLARLRMADLSFANLHNAVLNAADLAWADLEQADLKGARLAGANLSGANLRDVDLTNAFIGWTTFGRNDMSTVKGLDTVEHDGPSIIGIETIYRSWDKIPHVFLQQAGVPETFIAYMKGLAEDEVSSLYSCFISYSEKDKNFCDRLYDDLKARHVLVFYFREDAVWGKSVWGEIDSNINRYDKLLVVCSQNSLQSGPVLREIERALNREDKEQKNVLFPIRIDDYVLDKWEHERMTDVTSKVIGDFRGWDGDPEKYDVAFERLLKDLETNE